MSFIELKGVNLQCYFEREDEFFHYLDEEEKIKANKFKFPYLRKNYILSHAILRLEIGKYLQVNPSSISYFYGPFGKPFLVSKSLYFNMSHSENYVLYGFSFNVDLGVDIEYINPSLSIQNLPISFLTQLEQCQIFSLPPEKQKEHFYKLWTQNESYFKALGTGLQNPSTAIPRDSCWHFHENIYEGQYMASVAYRDPLVKRCIFKSVIVD